MKKRNINHLGHQIFHISRDLLIFFMSIVLAVCIVRGGYIHEVDSLLGSWSILAVFITGFFFTSVLTVAPAAAALGEFSQDMSLALVALVGALGAVLADVVLFRVLRDHVAEDLREIMKSTGVGGMRALRRSPLARRALSVLGALIIASPLPDELGIALMGASRMNQRTFVLIAYAMNVLGVVLVGLAARGF